MFLILYWCDHSKISAKIPQYPHDSMIDDNIWKVANEISDKGLSVMINSSQSILFVDTKLFSQR